MKTNEALRRAKNEIKNFDFDELAREIMCGGQHYSIIIDDDGSLYVDVDNMLFGRDVDCNKSLVIIDCPYYVEQVTSKRELAALKRELKSKVKERLKSIPSSYWL